VAKSKSSGSILDTVLGAISKADARRHMEFAYTLKAVGVKAVGVKAGKKGEDVAKAHHEAGHVLVGVSLGRRLKAGVRVGDDSDVDFWAREDSDDERRKERIQIAIAGPIAEANYAGASAGCASDLPLAFRLTSELDCDDDEKQRVLPDLAREVRATLRAAPVKALAAAILRTGSLSKKDVYAELAKLGWPM
jgi:3-oxoacyl-ACP reductase-like protein